MKLSEMILLKDYDTYIKDLNRLGISVELSVTGATDKDIRDTAKRLGKNISNVGVHFDEFKGSYWGPTNEGKCEEFDQLKHQIKTISSAGFRRITIHAPFYFGFMSRDFSYLNDARTKLKEIVKLAKNSTIYVENIRPQKSAYPFMVTHFADNHEELVKGTGAKIIVDIWHTGGVKATIKRLKDLKKKGFRVEVIHFHWMHMFLTASDLKLIKDSGFEGEVINEGYCKEFNVEDNSAVPLTPKQIIKKLEELKKAL